MIDNRVFKFIFSCLWVTLDFFLKGHVQDIVPVIILSPLMEIITAFTNSVAEQASSPSRIFDFNVKTKWEKGK